jgi:hypothetical protein
MPADGLISIASSFGPKETIDRLDAELKARGMTVFARVDHAAGAAPVDLELRANVTCFSRIQSYLDISELPYRVSAG